MSACEREVVAGPYLDGELSAAARVEFEAHLVGCATCREEVERMREVSRRLEPLRGVALSQAQKEELASVALAAADEPVLKIRSNRTVRWVRWLTAAAAAVFLFSVAQLFLARHHGDTTDSPGGNGVPAWTTEQQNKTPRHGGATTAPGERKTADPARNPSDSPRGNDKITQPDEQGA